MIGTSSCTAAAASGVGLPPADSPPIAENFAGTPIVTEEAYAYAEEEAVVH